MKRLGKGIPRSLSIGYPVNYEGAELGNAILAFSSDYPDVSINLRTGTHEGIYADLRSGDADIILNDQRRAFSDEYVNKILVRKPLYAVIASQDTLSDNECVEISQLIALPLIIIADESHRGGRRGALSSFFGNRESCHLLGKPGYRASHGREQKRIHAFR